MKLHIEKESSAQARNFAVTGGVAGAVNTLLEEGQKLSHILLTV